MARRISFIHCIETSYGTRNDRQQRQRDVIVAPMPLGKPKTSCREGTISSPMLDSAQSVSHWNSPM